MTLKKIDLDKDGKVSLEDFAGTVRKEPLLLEAFGQCLPEDQVVKQFHQEFLTKRLCDLGTSWGLAVPSSENLKLAISYG